MKRISRAGLVLVALATPAVAAAQPVMTSPGPDRVEVTVYRDPRRGTSAMELDWLNGFALISERRRVRLPAGESTVRFEGVAGGIVPQSAIVTGFPDGIVERNRDAYLLSPGTLLDRSLGRRVHLRRTSLANGNVREQDAVVLSGAGGAVMLETADGIESLRCTGLPETITYDEVLPGLSAKPTLSVRTRAAAPVEAEVTLSYLATGFDWQANYIAELSDDGRTMKLFAWLTLASTDLTSFVDADTQAVAGRVNYTDAEVPETESAPIELRCWPSETTSSVHVVIGGEEFFQQGRANIGDTLSELPASQSEDAENIVVTGSSMARQERLGDLKLYRIPEPVTVAANSQKQVALLIREDVPVQTVYRARTFADTTEESSPTRHFLVTRNREEERLGVPLPAGPVAAFVRYAGSPFLIGEGRLADRAVGEDVEIDIGESEGVRFVQEQVASDPGERWTDYSIVVTNDQPRAVAFEAELRLSDETRFASPRLPERDGMRIWAVTVPANGTMTLRYRLQRVEPSD